MGMTAYAHVIVGIRVFCRDFMVPEGSVWRCANSHTREEGKTDAFCSKCGARFSSQPVERPTEGLIRYARSIGGVPENVFIDMRDEDDDQDGFGIWPVHQVQTSEDDDEDSPLAIGFKISPTRDIMSGSGGTTPRWY